MLIKPRTKIPALNVPTLGCNRFDLAARQPKSFTMRVFYSGLHCHICKTYLRHLSRKIGDVTHRGVEVAAISTDAQEHAEQLKKDRGIETVMIAYGLSIDPARQWGLYISRSIKEEEPPLFAEPGPLIPDTPIRPIVADLR